MAKVVVLEHDDSSSLPKKSIFIWSHPRSVSTALLRSLAQLEHTTTILEPFLFSFQHSLGLLDLTKVKEEPSYEKTIKDLQEGKFLNPDSHFQIVKDMSCHLPFSFFQKLIDTLPDSVHIFLIRNPRKTIDSYFKATKSLKLEREVVMKDISLAPLCQYHSHLLETQKRKPFLIEADDLLTHPKETLAALCSYIGVSFSDQILKWEPGAFPSSWNDSLWAFDGWIATVGQSSGWNRKEEDGDKTKKSSNEKMLSDEMGDDFHDGFAKECYDALLPHYEILLSYKTEVV